MAKKPSREDLERLKESADDQLAEAKNPLEAIQAYRQAVLAEAIEAGLRDSDT